MNAKYQLRTLKNGLRVLLVPMPQVKSVTSLILVKTGSRNEKDQKAGISHFLEHMVFKGTKKYPSALKLASTVDGVGAEFNAFTDKEYTGFYVKSAKAHLDLALDVLKELVFNPLLPEKEIEKEKGVIVEEINMREDHPMGKVGEEFEILLYGLTALGRKIIGSKKTVRSLQKKDFLDYLKQRYHPENMLLCLAGAVEGSLPKLKDWMAVGPLLRRSFQKVKKDSLFSLQKKEKLRLIYQKTQQAHFCLGVPAFRRGHKDRYALSVLATILGGNMSSRLFTEVREKRGLAYYVKTGVDTFQDTGYLVSQAGVDLNKIDEAIKVIKREYFKIKPCLPVESSELIKAKEYLKGQLILNLEDSQAVASLFANSLLLEGKIRTPRTVLKGVDQVTVQDVERVGKRIFNPQKLYLAIVGPYKNRQRFEKLIG